MAIDFMDKISDFSYGVLVMTELAGFIVSTLLASKHRLMKVTALFLSWLLIVNVFYFAIYYIYAPENLYLYLLCDILEATIVPACLFFLLGITHPERLTWQLVAVNSLPYALAILAFFIVKTPIAHTLVVILPTLHALGILFYSYITIRDYNRSQLQIYSSLRFINLKWTRYLVVVFAAWIALWMLEGLSRYSHIDVGYDFLVTVIVAVTVYSMVRHAQMISILEHNLSAADEAIENNTEILAPPRSLHGHSSSFEKQFEALFAQDKIYLKSLLTIDELARALGSNRTYTSNYINQKLGTTFYNYVNSWRIKHAAVLLQESDLGIEEVARQSGFNSLTSFRKYFKEVYGVSASKFKKLRTNNQSVQKNDA